MLTCLGQLGMVTIMVLAQSRFLTEYRSPVDLTYLAHTVINLHHFEARGAIHPPSDIGSEEGKARS
jgi:hypothetical protein